MFSVVGKCSREERKTGKEKADREDHWSADCG